MKYEEINIGDQQTLIHTITQGDIEKFVDLTGDDNKLHVDGQFAAKTSFKRPVVHGMLGASFISTIIGTKLPGDGALWFSQTLEFLLPVRIGDRITVSARVVGKNDRERIIDLAIEIINQNRQVVTRGESRVKVVELIEVAPTQEAVALPPQRTALVVGATGGIGRATVLTLAADGFNVLVHYNSSKSKAESLVAQIKEMGCQAALFKADIMDEAQIAELVSFGLRKFSSIDVLVNCAASSIPPIKVGDLLWSDFMLQLELNIKANLLLIKGVLPSMLAAHYGRIVTIGTLYSDKPNSDLAHYVTAKSALIGLTKSLALELGPKGISVNMVSPSVISTDLTSDIPEKIKLMTAAQTPLRRLATPQDVAQAVCYLAGDRASFLNGENIRLNGGQAMV